MTSAGGDSGEPRDHALQPPAPRTRVSKETAPEPQMTRALAAEWGGRGVRVNAIAPGFIETEMTAVLDENVVKGWAENIPLKRAGSTQDIANAVVFLASDMSSYITGQVLSVDGGMHL